MVATRLREPRCHGGRAGLPPLLLVGMTGDSASIVPLLRRVRPLRAAPGLRCEGERRGFVGGDRTVFRRLREYAMQSRHTVACGSDMRNDALGLRMDRDGHHAL